MDAKEILKVYFGYDSFRDGQESIINAILESRDVLAIMPTGAGKSICYQVPALMLLGITIVISPLKGKSRAAGIKSKEEHRFTNECRV